MRVAIDATPLGSGRGGDESYLLGLLRGLEAVREEHQTFPLYLTEGVTAPGVVPDEAFPVTRLRSRSKVAHYLWALPRALARASPRADLMVATNHVPFHSPVARALIVHDLSFHHHPEFYPTRTRWRLATLVPLHLRQAAVVLTGTEFSRADLVRTYRLRPDHVHVVPPVIEPRAPAADGVSLRESLGVAETYFLYVGNLHPRKNLRRLVAAFELARASSEAMRRAQLVIAGAPWWGDDSLEASIAHLPRDSVLRLGRVTDPERDALLRGALALAYPSIFEGIGLPPLEAMSAGTPVLASRASSLPEVLGDAALLVDPRDVGGIARGLQRLAEDQELRLELGERGLRNVARFTAAEAGQCAIRAFRWALRSGSPAS